VDPVDEIHVPYDKPHVLQLLAFHVHDHLAFRVLFQSAFHGSNSLVRPYLNEEIDVQPNIDTAPPFYQ
jgi:hypothetical protein